MRVQFKSIDGTDKLYQLDIDDGDETTSNTLQLAADPFVVNYENKGTLYHPARYSGATINVTNITVNNLQTGLLMRFYGATPQQVKVKLFEGDKVRWVGYVTPTMYNQDYTTDRDVVQVDCVDGLSTLRYVEYKHITRPVNLKENNTVWTFLDVLINVINEAHCYKELYVTDTIQLVDDKPSSIEGWEFTDTGQILTTLWLDEDTFYDAESGGYMTCDVVLESICRYLSLTAVAVGEAVYLMNYDAIRQGATQYAKYTNFVANPANVEYTSVTVSHSYSINTQNSLGNASVALDNIYSRVTVKDDVKRYERLFTKYDEPSTRTIKTLTLGHVVDDNLIVTEYANPVFSAGNFHALMQIYEQKNYIPYQYTDNEITVRENNKDVKYVVVEPDASNSLVTLGKRGCCLVRQMTVEKKYGLGRDIQNLNFTDYIMLRTNWDMVLDSSSYVKMRYLDINLDEHAHAVLAAGAEGYLVVSGSMLFEDITDYRFIPTQYNATRAINAKEDIYLVCRLQIWDHYWNGTEWQYEPCDFLLPFNGDDNVKLVHNWFEVRNNITWLSFKDQLNATGWAIPLPFTQQAVEGVSGGVNPEAASYNVNAKFTIFGPKQVRTTSDLSDVQTVWIKDLSFDIYTRTVASEPKYEVVINEGYVEELNDDDFKLTTYDHRVQAFSHVSALAKKSANTPSERRFVQKIKCSASNISDVPEMLRARKLASHYRTPKIVLEKDAAGFIWPYSIVYNNNLAKYMLVDKLEWNYWRGNTRVTLVEP